MNIVIQWPKHSDIHLSIEVIDEEWEPLKFAQIDMYGDKLLSNLICDDIGSNLSADDLKAIDLEVQAAMIRKAERKWLQRANNAARKEMGIA